MQYVTPRDRGVTGFSTETVSPAKTASYDMRHMIWTIEKLKKILPLAAAKSEIAIFISKIKKYASNEKN